MAKKLLEGEGSIGAECSKCGRCELRTVQTDFPSIDVMIDVNKCAACGAKFNEIWRPERWEEIVE